MSKEWPEFCDCCGNYFPANQVCDPCRKHIRRDAMSQQLANLARLGVTAAVAYLAALLARQGFHLSVATTDTITGLLLVPAMYLANGVANWLSAHMPWLGHVAVKAPPQAAAK